ncbi:MAG: ADP-ribosylation factor-like protein [Promethearchaeota archaeon]
MAETETDFSRVINVFSKFLDPKDAKINKLKTLEDILKLPIHSYKFISKEESNIVKELLELSKIGEISKLNKENPFESLIKFLEEAEQPSTVSEMKENLSEKIEELKEKYPTLERNLKKAITISSIIANLEADTRDFEPHAQKIVVAGLDNAGKTASLSKLGGRLGVSDLIKTQPTKGVYRMNVGSEKLSLYIWDLGGQEEYRTRYLENPEQYFLQLDLLIYIIDIQDPDRFDDSLEYFEKILELIIILEENPYIIVFIHKFDPDLKKDPEILLNIELLKDKLNEILQKTDFVLDVEIYLTSIYSMISKEPQFAKYIKKIMSDTHSLADPTLRKVDGLGRTLEETMNVIIRLSESLAKQLNDIDSRLRAIESGAFQVAQSGIPIGIANPDQVKARAGESARMRVLDELKDLFAKKKRLDL